MDLSIIVPTYRGSGRLRATMDALREAVRPAGGAELVVVDDGSPEPPPEALIAASGLPARLVLLPRNGGRAEARNAGVAAACGALVLLLDDDMSVAPDVLAGHVEAHRAAGAPAAVLGAIPLAPPRRGACFQQFLASEEERRTARLASGGPVPFFEFMTGHVSLPRDLYLEIGGCDPGFGRYGFEDVELGWRLAQRGVALLFRPGLVATHRSDAASLRAHCRRHLDVGRMAAVFAAKHPDPAVVDWLRADGMEPARQANRVLRAMARCHSTVRRAPAPARTALLAAALASLELGQHVLPKRLRHAAYHIVRDMHYAAGLAEADRASTPAGAVPGPAGKR